MRYLSNLFFVLLLVLFMQCNSVYAKGVSVDASANNIPTSFTEGDSGSELFQCSGNVVEILNQTAEVLAIGFSGSASSPAQTDFAYIPSGPKSGNSIKLRSALSGEWIYIRSVGSAISSGTVQVSCFFGRD